MYMKILVVVVLLLAGESVLFADYNYIGNDLNANAIIALSREPNLIGKVIKFKSGEQTWNLSIIGFSECHADTYEEFVLYVGNAYFHEHKIKQIKLYFNSWSTHWKIEYESMFFDRNEPIEVLSIK